jgi:hypothetical protein
MERESTGTKYMAANCEGNQSPPTAVELRKKKKEKNIFGSVTFNIFWKLFLNLSFDIYTVDKYDNRIKMEVGHGNVKCISCCSG